MMHMTKITKIVIRTYAFVLLVFGLALSGGGGYLLLLHGSPYYLLCGVLIVTSAGLLWRLRSEGAFIYALVWLGTVAWALWEAGYDGWALLPRIGILSLFGLILLAPPVRCALEWKWRLPQPSRFAVIGALAIAIIAGVGLRMFLPPAIPIDPLYQVGFAPVSGAADLPPRIVQSHAVESNGVAANDKDWAYYGKDAAGTRFSTLAQITPANVAQLKLAWSYKIESSANWQVTPLKIDRTVYLCTGDNVLIALDAETGKPLWRFDPDVKPSFNLRSCRGVAYYHSKDVTGACAERIITNTLDARLIAVDAHDGRPCHDFGINGEVSLLAGMGEVPRGYYFLTSAPTIANGKIILGGVVLDWQYWGEPSGVIRAFDATTGKLAWAWDMGRPDRTGEPPQGESYTRSTPNSWAPMSVDETLGLVYVPMGNTGGNDYFGGPRRSFDERYSSAVVALDIGTGRPRWSFQTAHRDLWDWDVASQPTLADLSTAKGNVKAVIQPTKRGELFILDRATGAPIYPVEERPAPQAGAVPEERVAATQPYSTGLPSFRSPDLVEGDMWGLTPLDQLWCRISFKKLRYDGTATPPGLTPSLQIPSDYGGMNWGSVAVDAARGIAIVNSSNLPVTLQLITRAEAKKRGIKPLDFADAEPAFLAPQEKTPYANLRAPFYSPLKMLCIRPPYGRLSAVDLTSGQLVWTRVFGTARNMGPFRMGSLVPLPIGTPNRGGAAITQSGIFFIGATLDDDMHAYDTQTGKLLWQARLPGPGMATPITYLSADSGRQFVVIAAGGGVPHPRNKKVDLYLQAFALPKNSDK